MDTDNREELFQAIAEALKDFDHHRDFDLIARLPELGIHNTRKQLRRFYEMLLNLRDVAMSRSEAEKD
jgi:hypothetical protein